MQCVQCHGQLTVGRTNYTVNRNGYHLIIDDVPAFVCEQCGEPLFAEEAVRLVQQMVRALDARRAELNAVMVTG